jgi:hypothetical protein
VDAKTRRAVEPVKNVRKRRGGERGRENEQGEDEK